MGLVQRVAAAAAAVLWVLLWLWKKWRAHHADALPRVELRPPLAYDDVAWAAALPPVELDAQVLGVGVLVVLRAAALLLGRPAHGGGGETRCVQRQSGGLLTGASDGALPQDRKPSQGWLDVRGA